MGLHSATVSWIAPTTDVGGGPMTGLQGYFIYGGTDPLALTKLINIGLSTTLNYTFQSLPSYGVWYFTVSAYDFIGNEGPQSAMVSKQIIDDGPGGGFF